MSLQNNLGNRGQPLFPYQWPYIAFCPDRAIPLRSVRFLLALALTNIPNISVYSEYFVSPRDKFYSLINSYLQPRLLHNFKKTWLLDGIKEGKCLQGHLHFLLFLFLTPNPGFHSSRTMVTYFYQYNPHGIGVIVSLVIRSGFPWPGICLHNIGAYC